MDDKTDRMHEVKKHLERAWDEMPLIEGIKHIEDAIFTARVLVQGWIGKQDTPSGA